MDELEHRLFTGLLRYAEIDWWLPEHRDWEVLKNRLAHHGKRLEAMEINFYRLQLFPWPQALYAQK